MCELSHTDAIAATLVELQNSQVDLPVEVNGIVDSLTGNAAAFQFKIGSTLLKGDANTAFFGDGDRSDSCADLKNNSRVEVKGQQRDGFVYAARIHVEDVPQGPPPPEDTSASIDGVLKTIGGAAPTLVLTVNTTTVRTSANTAGRRLRHRDAPAPEELTPGRPRRTAAVSCRGYAVRLRLRMTARARTTSPQAAIAVACGHSSSRPMPLRKMPRTITRKYRSGIR